MSSDADIELSDLIESYISPLTPGFLELLTAKKEFAELASDPREKLEKGRFKFYKHQEFIHRYLRDYDYLLDISETGSGKSGSAIGFLEKALAEHEKAKKDPANADEKLSHIKRAIIIVGGKTQQNEFRHQLVCKVSDGHFEIKANEAKDEKAQRSAIKSAIKRAGYVVTTYQKFAKLIIKDYPIIEREDLTPDEIDANNFSLEKLIEDYSDTGFWIDEAQNLNMEPDKIGGYNVKVDVYKALWRVFHTVYRSKFIISTATPMLNSEIELAFLLNLVLPRDGVLPLGYEYQKAEDDDIKTFFPGLDPEEARAMPPEEIGPYFRGQIYISLPASQQHLYVVLGGSKYDGNDDEREAINFKAITYEELEPYTRGRVAFIRSADTGAIPIEQGNIEKITTEINGEENTTVMTTYNSEMSEFQNEGYMNTLNKGVGLGKGRNGVFIKERQAANFVFPDGYAGSGKLDQKELDKANKKLTAEIIKKDLDDEYKEQFGSKKYKQKKNVYAFQRYVIAKGDKFESTPEFKEEIRKHGVEKFSSKFAAYIRSVESIPGNRFTYDTFVEGSGGIVLSLCLELEGYERFNESSSVFINLSGNKSFCSPQANNKGERKQLKSSFVKKKRYALLNDSAITINKLQAMMELQQSYENRYGEYLKIIISSSSGREGINVFNCTAIDLLESEWNPSGNYQAKSRGVRTDSHEFLLRDAQKIIDDLSTALLVTNRNDLRKETIALITAMSGGIKLPGSPTLIEIIEALQLAIDTTVNLEYREDAVQLLDVVKINDEAQELLDESNPKFRIGYGAELLQINMNAITNIFPERRDLYIDYFNEWQSLNPTNDETTNINDSISILVENCRIMIKDLSVRTISVDVMKEFETLKAKLLQKSTKVADVEDLITPVASMDIKIFKHVALPLEGAVKSINLQMFRTAEIKSHRIERIMKFLRRSAITWNVFSRRNIRETDEDYEEQMQLVSLPKILDYSTYDIIYSTEIINNLQLEIMDLYRKYNSLSLSEIMKRLLDNQIEYILNAFETLSSYDIPFADKTTKSINIDINNLIDKLFPKYRSKVLVEVLEYFLLKNIPIHQYALPEKRILNGFETSKYNISNVTEDIIREIFTSNVPYRSKFVIMALEKLISNKSPLMDKFGYTVYIRENNGYFYLDKEYPIDSTPSASMSYYTSDIIAIKHEELNNISNIHNVQLSDKTYLELKKMNNEEEIIMKLDALTMEGQSNILEKVIIEALKSDPNYDFDEPKLKNNYIDIVIDKYRYFIIKLHEPVDDIRKVQNESLHKVLKKGRPANVNKVKPLPNILKRMKEIEDKMKNNDQYEIVYLNTLDSQVVDTTAHGMMARIDKGEGKTRLLKLSEIDDGWRNLNAIEIPIYNDYKQVVLDKRIKSFQVKVQINMGGDKKVAPVYGKVSKLDNVFRIVDKQKETIKAETSASSTVKGQVATTFKKPPLIDILWRIGGYVPEADGKNMGFIEITEENKEDIIYDLLNASTNKRIKGYTEDDMIDWDLDKLTFYYRWYTGAGFTVVVLCETIRERMEELNIIEYI